MRTSITIQIKQIKRLDEVAKRIGISRSSLIGLGIDEIIKKYSRGKRRR